MNTIYQAISNKIGLSMCEEGKLATTFAFGGCGKTG
jgi:hypothetical protein